MARHSSFPTPLGHIVVDAICEPPTFPFFFSPFFLLRCLQGAFCKVILLFFPLPLIMAEKHPAGSRSPVFCPSSCFFALLKSNLAKHPSSLVIERDGLCSTCEAFVGLPSQSSRVRRGHSLFFFSLSNWSVSPCAVRVILRNLSSPSSGKSESPFYHGRASRTLTRPVPL